VISGASKPRLITNQDLTPIIGTGGLWSAAKRRRFGPPAERGGGGQAKGPFGTAPPQHVGKDQGLRPVSMPFVPGTLVSRVGCGGAAQDAHLLWPDHLGACHKLMVAHDFRRKMVKMLTCAH